MTDPGADWASPSGGWQPPTYDPSYPQTPAPGPATSVPMAPPPAPSWQGWGPAWIPMPGVVPLRPLGVGELLDGGVKIIRKYPKPTLALSALIAVAVALINIAFSLAFQDARTISATSPSNDSSFSGYDLSSLPGMLLGGLGGVVLTGALVTVVSRAILGQSASFSDAWAATRPRFWALLGLALLRGVILAGPIVVVVLLGVLVSPLLLLLLLAVVPLEVWLWTVTTLAAAPLMLEKVGVLGALRRSRALAMRSFWRTLGVLCLCTVITYLLSSILLFPVILLFELPLFTNGSVTFGATYFVSVAVATGVVQTLVAPYTAGLRALVYIDQRMRSEGLDVALQAAASTPTSTAAPLT
ncbi:MAG: integral rane protein [Frankiales bacterium]|nr:integral rane protein [Frankiales bacterium]